MAGIHAVPFLDTVSTARPAQSPPAPMVITQARKALHAHLAADYADVSRQIETVTRKLQDLLQTKVQLEMLAAVSGVTLECDADARLPR